METKVSPDEVVRSAKLLIGTSNLDKNGKRTNVQSYLDRPVHKLIILAKVEQSKSE